MFRNFCNKFQFKHVPNALTLLAKDNFRPKNNYELLSRVALNTHPYGRVIDGFANGIELYGHLSKASANAYYKNNARNINDEFERNWDAFKRATDIDYS